MLLENASQILTFSQRSPQDQVILTDGSIAIDKGIIVEVGKAEELRTRFDADLAVEATGKVVTPGLIDCHTHLVFAGSREQEIDMRIAGAGYMEILRLGGGILRTMYETRATSREKLVAQGRRVLDNMLLHGTTTVEAKSGYGLTVEDELKMLEALRDLDRQHPIDLAPTFMGAHAVPPEYRDKPDEYIKLVTDEMIPRVAERRLAQFCDVFCDEGVFSVEQARRVLRAGLEYGLLPKIHAEEFANIGASKLAMELGAVSADHLLHSSLDDLVGLARAGVVPVFLPAASLTLMEGRFAEASAALRNDVQFAFASDFNPSCPTQSLQFVLALSCFGMRVPILEALRGVTLNAARAIRRDRECGSIEPGKKADLVIFNVSDYRHLLQHLGVNLVSKVIKNGVIVVEDGKILDRRRIS
jgi:imidazolonepropionase